jgi:P4 family phage/plasmid primase-like protien
MTIEILEEENASSKVNSKQDSEIVDSKEVKIEVDNKQKLTTLKKLIRSYVGTSNEIVDITDFLLTLEEFKYIVICPPLGFNYYYDDKEGCYKKVSDDYIERLIDSTLIRFGIKFTYLKIKNLYKQISLKKGVEESDTKDSNYVCFSNGIYNLHTQELIPHIPDIFCTDNLGFPYLENCSTSTFMDYLKKFCNYKEEKKDFLRYWLKLLIHNYPYTQTFLVIIGPGGSGKFVFEMICKALVGDRNTVTTSFSSMNNDRFEPINFKNKSLVSISDSERFRGTNLSPLKMLTGGDRIQGRIKLTQGSYDFIFEGLIIITSNFELNFDDSSGAIERRMRTFYATESIKVNEQKMLLVKTHDSWIGPLSKELPGIFKWAVSVDLEKAANEVKTKFLSDTSVNTFKMWVKECLIKRESSFIGYNLSIGPKEMLEASRRGLLYPFYLDWCHKHNVTPEKHRMFYSALVRNVPFSITKVKRAEGAYVKGVVLRKEVLNRDNIYGGTLLEIPKIGEVDIVDPEKVTIDENLYKKYMDLLKIKSPYKKNMNSKIRGYLPSTKQISDVYFEGKQKVNKEYRDHVEHVIGKGLEIIKK